MSYYDLPCGCEWKIQNIVGKLGDGLGGAFDNYGALREFRYRSGFIVTFHVLFNHSSIQPLQAGWCSLILLSPNTHTASQRSPTTCCLQFNSLHAPGLIRQHN